MKRNDAFPSKYVSQADVEGGPVRGAIEVVQPEEIKNDNGTEEKAVLYLKSSPKGLILNGTTWDQVADIAREKGIHDPDDSDNWVGLLIELYQDPSVKYGNKRTGGVRVRKPAPVTRTQGAKLQRPAPAPERNEPELENEEPPVPDDADAPDELTPF